MPQPKPPKNGKGPDKTPVLEQVKVVQRNPFTPASVEPRPDARIVAHADLTKEYVPSGLTGYYPFLRALPPFIDDISQQFGLAVYERMMTDPVIYASERVFTLAILAGGYELVPSLSRDDPDYDLSVKMRDFVQENLDRLETPYDVTLEQQLNAFEYGASVAEMVYTSTRDGELRLRDLREKPLINAVFVVDSYNNTVGIMTQRFPGQAYPAGSYIPIDLSLITAGQGVVKPGKATDDKNEQGEFDLSKRIPGFLPRHLFSVLTNEMRYNDERGHSGLRAAYSAWWFKQQIIAEYLSCLSKFGTPSLVGVTAEHAVAQTYLNADGEPLLGTDGLPLQKTPEQVLSEALAEFQNGSAIAIPFGSSVTPINATGNGEAFVQALNFANSEMVRGITYQYLATSEGLHQARSASETHQDILSLGILRRKHWLAAQQQREVYARLLRYNFDLSGQRIARYVPRLSLGMGDGFPITPDSIARLVQAGYIDPSQHERIDERLGLPKRETVTVNGVKMTPTQMQQQQREQQQAALAAQQQSSVPPEQGAAGGPPNVQKALTPAGASYALPAIVVNVPEQPAPHVTVNVPPAEVTINVPEQPAPEHQVYVSVPEQPAPVVNVAAADAPQVNVEVQPAPVTVTTPTERKARFTVVRDANDRIVTVEKEYV